MIEKTGMMFAWGKKIYGWLFGTRLELSRIHEVNSKQSMLLAEILQEVQSGFVAQGERLHFLEESVVALKKRVECLEAELSDVQESLSIIEEQHRHNH